MENFFAGLQQQRDRAEAIAAKAEHGEAYMGDLKGYIPSLNQTILALFGMMQNSTIPFSINQEFVLQVLSDIVYGMEQEDPVYLTDVLRYGLVEVFDYIDTELQREGPK